MPLQSKLFAEDPLLERAATVDSAHIKLGASGSHVRKIQLALNVLCEASLPVDGQYGVATAKAVLEFKKKRGIINKAYQSVPDNIVGKMTIAAMDAALAEEEQAGEAFEVIVVTPTPYKLKHTPAIAWRSGYSITNQQAFAPQVVGAPLFESGPIVEINKGQVAIIRIRNGVFRTVWSANTKIASITKSNGAVKPLDRLDVWLIGLRDTTIEVRGEQKGGTVILVSAVADDKMHLLPERELTISVTVVVKEPTQTVYVATMVPHNHRPVDNWDALLEKIPQPNDDSDSRILYELKLKKALPEVFVAGAIAGKFKTKPVAYEHLRWYLTDGRGQEFNEDANIKEMMRLDNNFQEKFRSAILAQSQTSGSELQGSGTVSFSQPEYEDQDFRFAFGTIELISYQYDFVAKTFKVWFKDSYEWHPYCPGFYVDHGDDGIRQTNTLNAALVQLKNKGAADFWMKGEATFPLNFLFPNLN
jgi:peptidoglycan hydrolase-like protein with peptidoglycan-binding domain